MQSIKNGTFDLFGALESPTPQRETEFDYSEPLFTVRWLVAARFRLFALVDAC